MDPIPLLDLTRQNADLESEFMRAFERVLKSGRYISGPEVEAFEGAVATYTDTKHAIAVSSGTDALLVALMALGIGPGDEVICPSFTFFATAGCVARLGATPVFVDCDPTHFNISPIEVERAITPKTKAIVPVHLFGQTAEMDLLLNLASQHGLKIIEDAAQALGARDHDRPAGSMGDLGTFSFFPSKNLGGFGEGGMIVTTDGDLAHRCRILRNHGMEPRYHHSVIGGNFRLDEIQAALLDIKLKMLDRFAESRRTNAGIYSDALADLTGIVTPSVTSERLHIWNQYTIKVSGERRDALREYLAKNGIASEIYYPVPLHQQECFQHLKTRELPVSDQLAEEVLSLPVFPELTREQITHVAQSIRGF